MSLVDCYRGKRVLITGDTGFKGSWLAYWLCQLGAEVTGYALPSVYPEGPFEGAKMCDMYTHVDGDIRSFERLCGVMEEVHPDVVFHLAAQALVRKSYLRPLETVSTNIIGTVHLLEAVRLLQLSCAIVVVSSDKCYENKEWGYSYRENDAMGGHDVYSATKGCAELMVSSYRRSFFQGQYTRVRTPVATVRAGNVIGPGDWAADRIIPDAMRSVRDGTVLRVRNPSAVRPWQHVLEPLSGYLWLGCLLQGGDSVLYEGAWNFGPNLISVWPVHRLVDAFMRTMNRGEWMDCSGDGHLHEASCLALNIDKTVMQLNWHPVWDMQEAVTRTAEGYWALKKTQGDYVAFRGFMKEEIDLYCHNAIESGVAWAMHPAGASGKEAE
ncbi:MAG: CDP-glucose 4,6-dehydratase [Verrucomicrobiae bacterium]|nr:CDP-glucose 4,6-dehydratase [Verrucomicrobiae bacterium]